LPFLLWFVAATERGRWPSRLVRTWPLLAAVAVVATPVLVRNHQLSGMFALRHHMAINLYLGNRPEAAGYHTIRPGRDWDRLSFEPEREGGAKTLPEHEAYFRDRVLEFLRDDPVAFAALQFRKLFLFFHERELRVIMSPYFFDRFAPLQSAPWLPDFGWVGPLAIVGLVLGVIGPRRPWLLYAFAVPQGLAVVLTVVGSRYRLPVVPFLIGFAAYALVRIVGWLRSDQRRAAAIAVAGVVAAAMIVHQDVSEPGGFAEEMERVAFVYEERGELEEAARWWVGSFQEDPSRVESYVGYAALALEAGDDRRAVEVTALGLELKAGDGDLLALRGRAFLRLGRPDSAAAALSDALEDRPEDADVLADLGRALFDLGRTEESVESFRRSLRVRDDFPDVLLDAARVLVETHAARPEEDRTAVARGLLERVLELEPDHAEAQARLRDFDVPRVR
jgi:Tfp pilus assembly protein PilF